MDESLERISTKAKMDQNKSKKDKTYAEQSEEYTKGITNLLPKAHHLIYMYYKMSLFWMKFGRQRDWIHQI